MTSSASPLKVHLVGSVPLGSANEVFRTVGSALGQYLPRIPDGETGRRKHWIGHIGKAIAEHPDFELDADEPPLEMRMWDGTLFQTVKQSRFREGVVPANVKFDTGYAESAIESYTALTKLQKEGAVPSNVRLMVALPSPAAPAYNYISRRDRDAFLEAFGNHLIGEVRKITGAVPHERLAVQWDVCQEILIWENYFPNRLPDYKERLLATLQRMGEVVPEGAELGYHFCYGSPKDDHMVQPTDTANMVEIANGLSARVRRPINFLHLPVPKQRTDTDYFRPLAGLKLKDGTELYLGLVHTDDEDGNRRRLDAASQFAGVRGVSTECGWGRKDSHLVPAVMLAHSALCAASPS